MAIATTSTVVGYFTTDAGFRTIGSAISTAIQSVGVVQTSDTGQINWTTVIKPTTFPFQAGYEIYKFNDTLQATAPVYIKIEYGTSTISASYLGLWITVSTSTDGAGNMTGNVSNRFAMASNSNSDTATRTSYFSGSTNRLCFALWPNLMAGNWFVFSIERTHDASGVDTNTAVHIFTSAPTILGQCQYLPLGVTTSYLPPFISGGWYCSAPLAGAGGGALGANVYTYPIRSYAMYETRPIFNMIHYSGSDITSLSQVSVTGYDGVNRNYIAPGLFNTTLGWFAFAGSNITSTNVAMRYD
jgi:hypothetical protein